MEVAAFVIGVIGPVELSIKLIQGSRARSAADKDSGRRLTNLEQRFTEFHGNLDPLRKNCDGNFRFLDETQKSLLLKQMKTMQCACDKALSTLNSMGEVRDKSGRVKRLTKALAQKESLDIVEENVKQAEESLNQLNMFLSTWKVMEKVTAEHAGTLQSFIAQRTQVFPGQIGSTREPVETFTPSFEIPSNPAHVLLDYQDPTTFEARLKAAILHPGKRQHMSLLQVTGALGMGGTGKTCAMKGLADEAEIRERFSQGVYFISLGMDADREQLTSQLRKIVRVSGGLETAKNMSKFESADIDDVVGIARDWFNGKDCLFLVDDMWVGEELNAHTLTQLSKLATCSENSFVAFTTRSQDIASLGEVVRFEDLDSDCDKSWDILLRCAGFARTEITAYSQDAVERLLTICDGLPVGLAIVGSTVRMLSNAYEPKREEAWLEYLRTYENPGEAIVRSDIDNYKSLRKTVRASLKILEAKCEEQLSFNVPLSIPTMFRSLSILEKQESENMENLRRLWRLESSEQALRVARCFEQVSLVNLLRDRDDKWCLQLHDLTHDLACTEAAEHESLAFWHRQFLEGLIPHDDESKRRGFRSLWRCCADFDIDNIGQTGTVVSKLRIKRHLQLGGLGDELVKLEEAPRWVYVASTHSVIDVEPSLCLIKALRVVGKERSERAIRCVDDVFTTAARLVAVRFDDADPMYGYESFECMTGLVYAFDREVDSITKAFRSGEHPYCRTGTEVIDRC